MPKLLPLLSSCLCIVIALCSSAPLQAEQPKTASSTDAPTGSEAGPVRYREILEADSPVAFWGFGDVDSEQVANVALSTHDVDIKGTIVGHLVVDQPGPRSHEFPYFDTTNRAFDFPRGGGYIRIADPGENSALDFDKGDSLSIEAWVNPRSLSGSGFHYIIAKGRTGLPGFAKHNQNFALRLKAPAGALSFLFRSTGKNGEWHRWTSKVGISAGDGWHHIAVTYTFGSKGSVRGYIDGVEVKGKWDMGGATDRAPIVDDDEVRIGESLNGLLDEVALYRTALTHERIKARFKYNAPPLKLVDWETLPEDAVLVDVFEGVPNKKSWNFRTPPYVESFSTRAFGFIDVPKKYGARGLRADRNGPFLIRAVGRIRLPKGVRRILLRSRNAARLYVDGQRIAETAFHNISGSAHGTVFTIDRSLAPNIRLLARGDTEDVAVFEGDGELHHVHLEMIVGGGGRRAELGETSVSIAAAGEDFHLLATSSLDVPLTDNGWNAYARDQRVALANLNTLRRREAGRIENEYWTERHEQARREIENTPASHVPELSDDLPVHNDIDRFIGARLEAAGQKPAALTSDLAFLRRVTLDAIGTVPTLEMIDQFLNEPEATRRSRTIDRLLDRPGWADNWVGYWQDVLAENPSLIKPKLNNSGPFRWWLHESFSDNKPFDRFVTELVRMEGSQRFGGPAGFEMATQNDAPMAAKAQIIGRAFLGLNMTCARCHDAPYHDILQEDLFSLAAMLKRGPLTVPKTSSIPGGDAAIKSLLVKVTLKPGTSVKPAWTFADVIHHDSLPEKLKNSDDQRDRLAALITSPHNQRFAEVAVNRLWKRYLGRALVEPVDDWQDAECSHPELMGYLAREFVMSGYDLKQIARLILNSHVYQRVALSESDIGGDDPYLFGAPLVRRMSAEQLVDSLFVVAGKPFDAGPMCLDIDTSMNQSTAMNLGEPTRAWQFAALSNERDRPSLALPFAQPFVTALQTFGWRNSRQNPISVRDEQPAVLQPAVLANGIVGRRVTRLSDDSGLTELALLDQPPEQLVTKIYLRMLSRYPLAVEREMFIELLREGYAQRQVATPFVGAKQRHTPRGLVSWSNHLNPRANEIKVELQRIVEQGDTPTARLEPDWRERMEDMVWTLMNTPEFVHLP